MATEVSPLLQSIPPQPTTPGVDRLLHVGSEVDRPLYVGSADDNVNGDVQESVKISETRDMIQHSASDLETMMNLMKGMVGIGILAMPAAMKNAGLWVGFGGILLITLVTCHCMHQLVHCAHYLCDSTDHVVLSYGEVAQEAFNKSRLNKFSSAAKMMVNVFLCMTQFGFCIVYILFIADNLRQVVGVSTWPVPVRLYEFFVFLALVPFSFVRDLRHLARFSLLANVLVFVGLVIVLQYCMRHLGPTEGSERLPAFASWRTLPLFFGMTVFALEGIGVVLPIENKVRRREHFVGLTGVMNTSLILVVILYLAVGFFGYVAFGADSAASVTLNLPGGWLYVSVKLMFAVAVFITYGLQFYVPAQILWPPLRDRLHSPALKHYGEYVMRFTFVTATFAIAVAIPHLDLMIALIGALASCTLAMIFPPCLDIITFWPDQLGVLKWRLLKDLIIIVFALCGFFSGTITTVIALVHAFSADGHDTLATDAAL